MKNEKKTVNEKKIYATEVLCNQCSRKCVQQLKKCKKSSLFGFKKKRTYSFTGHLITLPSIHNYQRSVLTSKSLTSDIVLRNVDTRKCNLEVCDKRLQVPITSGNFGAKIFIDIQYFSEACEPILVD